MSAMKPYYSDDSVTLFLGDATAVLSTLEPGSVDCIVTSPPYFGLRDYGVDGQIGAEPSPAEFVAAMVTVFRAARRVLADDGTLWINLGDTYYSGRGASHGVDPKNPARRFGARSVDKGGADWAKPKDLLGIPWRVAFALQDDGWILRNDIIWAKPNGMPESVTDRLASKHEHLFMFAKSTRYHFDLDAIRVPHSDSTVARLAAGPVAIARRTPGEKRDPNVYGTAAGADLTATGKNPGDVWTIATVPFSEAHFATFPVALPERCIQAGCKPGGTVLDPFSGSGTTGLAAARHGRRYVGIDLNREYLDLSLRTRLAQPGLDLEGLTA